MDFRTPRFDLDNLYGRGPDDQPYMYDDDRVHLLPGAPIPGNAFDPGAVHLPRGPNGRALIGDPRNDENRIVAQLHAVFLRFHNRVVDHLGGKKQVSFPEAREQVRWHYQWMLVHDFLPAILDEETTIASSLITVTLSTKIPRLRENDLELMPVEFSVAAYRFGHSMIRPGYRLNPVIENRPDLLSDYPDDFRADLGDSALFRPSGPSTGSSSSSSATMPSTGRSCLIRSIPLWCTRSANCPNGLPRILRAWRCATFSAATFQLPSGQDVARALGMRPLDDEKLMIGMATAEGPQKPITEVGKSFVGNAPLWVYVLSEAQAASWKKPHPGLALDKVPIKLGPVDGRLVAEVFASLLRGDPTSYVNAEHEFQPFPEFSRGRTFGLAELINVALGRTS